MCALQHKRCCLNKVFRPLLHSDAPQEGYHLLFAVLVCLTFLLHHVQNVARERIYGIVHGHHLGRVLMVVVDNGLPCKFRHTHDAVGVVHTVLFNSIHGGVNVSA